jgi:hypothetical protein
MRRLAALALFLVPLSIFAAPVEKQDDSISWEESVEMANQFSHCAGFWDFMAETSTAEGKPKQGEFFHTYANGARTAAGYVLSLAYALAHPGEPGRAYGSWGAMIDGRAEAEKIRMGALMEADDGDGLAATGELCKGLLPAQEAAVQAIREQIATRKE